MSSSFAFNNASLIAFLTEHHLNPCMQEESGLPYISYPVQGYEIIVFFLLRQESHLLQIMAYLPFKLPKATVSETARMLHILNKELDMPGFGMDEEEELVFYRSVIPCPLRQIDKKLFQTYLTTSRFACTTFLQAIKLLASGEISLHQLIEKGRMTNRAEDM